MKIFCSGIGGIGLSAYAAHMHERGHDVSGTDASKSAITDALENMGVHVSFLQDGSAVPKEFDLLVYSEAIPTSSPERVRARERGVTECSYFKALGDLTRGTNLLCVSGTHGKSSTTAMLAGVLIDANKDPSVVLGTKSANLDGKNWRKGNTDLWLVEACEYRRSFHFLSPKVILLTNADGDHFDAFKDKAEYESAFVEFVKSLPKDGVIVYHKSDKDSAAIVAKSGKKGIDADDMPLVTMGVPGLHMRQNAQLVLKACEALGIPLELSKKSLEKFSGTWRRMEKKGLTSAGVTVIDDYAHHPKEIAATLSAMKEAYPKQKIVCVFQPHTHHRTLALWDDFSRAFKDAHTVLLTDVYDARPDKDAEKVEVLRLAEDIKANSKVDVLTAMKFDEAKIILETEVLSPGDILITMGAGDITKLSDSMFTK